MPASNTMDFTVGDPPPGCTCGPYWSVVPPGPCPHHTQWWPAPAAPMQPAWTWTGTNTFPTPPRLSDDDVDRIAAKVAEKLAAMKAAKAVV